MHTLHVVYRGSHVRFGAFHHAFSQLAAFSTFPASVTGDGEPVRVPRAQVTATFFSLMGVQPAFGRALSPADNPTADTRAVVLSDAVWRSRSTIPVRGSARCAAGIGSQNRLTLVKAGLLLTLGQWGLRKSLGLVAGRASLPREATESLLLRFQHFRPRMEKLPIRTDDELASLEMPVQLILGGNDTLIRSKETRDRMERWAPNLHLTYLENEGHILLRQTTAISDFLKAVVS